MRSSFSFSPSSIFETGMPVHFDTTSAISSSVTLLRTSWVSLDSAACASARRFSSAGILPYCSSATLPRSPRAARRLDLELDLLEFLLDRRAALERGLLGLPDLLEIGGLLLEPGQRLLERGQALLGGRVVLLLERHLLDLELDDAPVEAIERLGLGVDLHADARAGLVDQVDRLVGQLAVGDVAVRERRGGDDGRIGDLDAVMHLVALLQAAQDRDRVLDRGLVRPAPSGSAARARRPSRCTCDTHRAWWRRRSAARRAPARA